MALGTALVVAVLLIQGVVRDSFLSNSGLGYDMIAGKKGGALQLTVNSVFYLSKPIENLPYDFYLKYKKAEDRADGVAGEYSSLVDFAIPICLGDYVGKYRAVGTTPEMFELLRYGSDEKPFEFREGRNFEEWNEENGYFEAVVGSHVANDLDIKMGDTVSPVHGAVDGAV
ncbi:MAG: ABC transporter permease, partial [Pirellulaceae bacterium]|nr:ABC transporter permease [Pirellulaceae bacterium]